MGSIPTIKYEAHEEEDEGPSAAGVFKNLILPVDNDAMEEEGPIHDLADEDGSQTHTPIPGFILHGLGAAFVYGYTLSSYNALIPHLSRLQNWCDRSQSTCSLGRAMEILIYAMPFIGAIIGAIPWSNTMGKRQASMIGLSFLMFGYTTSAVGIRSLEVTVWSRFVCGVGVGVISIWLPGYFAELAPKADRELYAAAHQQGITVGILAGTLMSLILMFPATGRVTPQHAYAPDETSAFVYVWLPIICILGFGLSAYTWLIFWKRYKFETPHWYLEKNEREQAKAVLALLYNKPDIVNELNGIETDILGSIVITGPRQGIFSINYTKVVAVACALTAAQQLTGINVFIASSTRILIDSGMVLQTAAICTVLITAINWLAGLLFHVWTCCLSRKSILIIGSFFQIVGLGFAALCYRDTFENSGLVKWGTLGGVVIYTIGFAGSFGPITWIRMVEMFPLHHHRAGPSIAIAVHWFIAAALIIAVYFTPTQGKLFVLLGSSLISMLLAFTLDESRFTLPVEIDHQRETPF